MEISILLNKIALISGTISAIFIAVIAYSLIRMHSIESHEKEHRQKEIDKHINKKAHEAKNPRWELILDLMQSPAEADWRMAIIEADILLEESLTYTGFTGFGVGEMLTNANPKSFATYQSAWEAHKVRNDISHMGSAFKLNREDANRTLNFYRSVFEEFGVI